MKYGLMLIAVFACLCIHGQDNTFYRKYNLPGMQGGLQLEATSDGGFVATGQHEGNGSYSGCDVYVYRVDACGNNLWFKLYGSAGADGGKSIKQTADGGYIIAGHYADSQGFLMKIDADGNVIWTKSYPVTVWVFYADETANGDFICMGHNNGLLYVFRTDSNGNVLWSKQVLGLGQMSMYIDELPNGDFIFTSSYGVPGKDIALARLSGSGNFIYGYGFGGSGWGDNDHTTWSSKGIIDITDNSIVITSPTYLGQGGEEILLVKADVNTGQIIWSKTYGGTGSDQSRDIVIHNDGYAFVGNTNSFPVSTSQQPSLTENMSERDILLVNVDHNGDLLWARTYGGDNRDKGIGVKTSIDGGFTMSAYSNSTFFGNGGSMDPIFIKTDSIGMVACQISTPPIVEADVVLSTSVTGSFTNVSITGVPFNFVLGSYTPNDVYICQACSTEPLFQTSDTLVCVNEPVLFQNTTTIGLTCFQNWLVDGQTYIANEDSLEYSFANPGVYEVELYSSCGSQNSTFTTSIHVYEPIVSIVDSSNYNGVGVSCFGSDDGWIQGSVAGGLIQSLSDYSWQWNPTGQTNALATNLISGNYELIVSDIIGCTDTIDFFVSTPSPLQVDAWPISDYSGFNISCIGLNDGSAEAMANGGVGPYSYVWSSGSMSSIQSGLFAGMEGVMATDANGCSIADSTLLIEPTALNGELLVISNYNGYEVSCYQGSDGEAVFSGDGGVAPYNIQWNGQLYNNGSVMTGLSAQGVDVLLIDANGCEASFSDVLEDPEPLTIATTIVSDYNGAQISCPGADNGQAVVDVEGGVFPYTYLWDDGSTGTHSNPDLGEGYAFVNAVDANGCIIQDSVLLEYPDPIQLTAQIDSDYSGYAISCFGFSDGAVSATGSGGSEPLYFWWNNFTDGPINNGISAGISTVYLTDANYCDTVSVSLDLIEPDSILFNDFILSDYNGYNVSCFGADDASAESSASGGVAPYWISWSNGDFDETLESVEAGTYTVDYIDQNGCISTEEINLTEPLPLTVNVDMRPDSCGKNVGTIDLFMQGGVPEYSIQWLNTDSTTVACCLSEGNYEYTVLDANGCRVQSSVDVYNIPIPGADFSIGTELPCSNQTNVQFWDQSTLGAIGWFWSFGDGTYSGDINATHVYSEPGVYDVHLEVINDIGCIGDAYGVIEIKPDLRVFIPNAFTPDQDGNNEAFFPDGSGIDYYDMTIFNKWGEPVFNSNEITPKWNGSYLNQNMFSEQDIYIYKIEVHGFCESKEFVGHVVLLR